MKSDEQEESKDFIAKKIERTPTLKKFLEEHKDAISYLGLSDDSEWVIKGLFCLLHERGALTGIEEAKKFFAEHVGRLTERITELEAELSLYEGKIERPALIDDIGVDS